MKNNVVFIVSVISMISLHSMEDVELREMKLEKKLKKTIEDQNQIMAAPEYQTLANHCIYNDSSPTVTQDGIPQNLVMTDDNVPYTLKVPQKQVAAGKYKFCPRPYENDNCNACRRNSALPPCQIALYNGCTKVGLCIGQWTVQKDPCSCDAVWFPTDCSSRFGCLYTGMGWTSSLCLITSLTVMACAYAPWWKYNDTGCCCCTLNCYERKPVQQPGLQTIEQINN